MPAPKPTLRTLARSLGLSHTTVSDALRGAGRVDPATVDRVRRKAREAGYRHNPLAATLMSSLRRSHGTTFRGLLASLDLYETGRPPADERFHDELLAGATARARDLGFKIESFVVGRAGLTVPRLDSILQSRGINAVLLLPEWDAPDWSLLDWTRYAGVYTDYNIERPSLHCVCCDHYRSMMAALVRLAALGYRRPGLFLLRHRDERIQHLFSMAFQGFQQNHPGIEAVPSLCTREVRRDEFMTWFKQYQPDVVLGHTTDLIGWMESCGARVPATHGFVILNMIYQGRPCAGLDQHPEEIGARGIELLIAQLQRNERGLPGWPTTTTIPARWVDGPTVRPQAGG